MLHINGLVQEKRSSSAAAMELRLSYTKPLICGLWETDHISLVSQQWKSLYLSKNSGEDQENSFKLR